ncbi:MAG: phasin family protein [Chloroflexota bacterium]|nr:MAG: hypothetical protein DLM70_10045 [Chloroflexota bacterium]
MDEKTLNGEAAAAEVAGAYSGRQSNAPVAAAARRVVLAGIGAVAMAADMADETFDRLVERGQKVQSELKGRVDDTRHQNAGARERVQEYYRSAVDACLDRVNLPSKGDLETINVKLNVVSRKLDDLHMRAAQSGGIEPEPPVVPVSQADDLT